jgi:hypothetical protein
LSRVLPVRPLRRAGRRQRPAQAARARSDHRWVPAGAVSVRVVAGGPDVSQLTDAGPLVERRDAAQLSVHPRRGYHRPGLAAGAGRAAEHHRAGLQQRHPGVGSARRARHRHGFPGQRGHRAGARPHGPTGPPARSAGPGTASGSSGSAATAPPLPPVPALAPVSACSRRWLSAEFSLMSSGIAPEIAYKVRCPYRTRQQGRAGQGLKSRPNAVTCPPSRPIVRRRFIWAAVPGVVDMIQWCRTIIE